MKTPTRQLDADGLPIVGTGFFWNDLEVGDRFRTLGRTISEADVTLFVGVTGMVEEMFTNTEYIAEASLMGTRPVPGSFVFCIAEALLMQTTMQRTGMAFLEASLKIERPTNAGDTLHVRCEVVEARGTRQPGKGLVRTRNEVVNQRGEVVATYEPLRMVKGAPR